MADESRTRVALLSAEQELRRVRQQLEALQVHVDSNPSLQASTSTSKTSVDLPLARARQEAAAFRSLYQSLVRTIERAEDTIRTQAHNLMDNSDAHALVSSGLPSIAASAATAPGDAMSASAHRSRHHPKSAPLGSSRRSTAATVGGVLSARLSNNTIGGDYNDDDGRMSDAYRKKNNSYMDNDGDDDEEVENAIRTLIANGMSRQAASHRVNSRRQQRRRSSTRRRGKLYKGSAGAQPPRVLPKLQRMSAHAPRDPLTQEEANMGLYDLVQRGYIPPTANLTAALDDESAPIIRPRKAQFHNYHEQFEGKHGPEHAVPYDLDVGNLHLDLSVRTATSQMMMAPSDKDDDDDDDDDENGGGKDTSNHANHSQALVPVPPAERGGSPRSASRAGARVTLTPRSRTPLLLIPRLPGTSDNTSDHNDNDNQNDENDDEDEDPDEIERRARLNALSDGVFLTAEDGHPDDVVGGVDGHPGALVRVSDQQKNPHASQQLALVARTRDELDRMLPPDRVALQPTHMDFPGGDHSTALTASSSQSLSSATGTRNAATANLHTLIIRDGSTIQNTQDYRLLRRKYAFMWTRMDNVLRQIENLMRTLHVQLAYIVGQRLVEVAEDVAVAGLDGKRLRAEMLLSCVDMDDRDRAEVLRRLPGRRFAGPQGLITAVVKIQSTYRMWRQRRSFLQLVFQLACAIRIQRAWRAYTARRITRNRIRQMWVDKLGAWQHTMDEFAQLWPTLERCEHVVVHIPSLSFASVQRMSMHNFMVRQNLQMSRLCDLRNPNVSVVYVCPFEPSDDVIKYYEKLLSVGGVQDHNRRLRILWPEAGEHYPSHFSLARMTLLSPQLLRRIRAFIRGRPAYIVPGAAGDEDLRLAVELNFPLFGATPSVAHAVGSKSGARRLAEAAQVTVAPGDGDIHDMEQLCGRMASLVLAHMETPRWVLKTNNESGGRGIAWLDVDKVKLYASLKRERDHNPRWNKPEVMSYAEDRLRRSLKSALAERLEMAVPEAHNDSVAEYLMAFFNNGGMVEAFAHDGMTVASPSVSAVIEPDGDVRLLSASDKIFSRPFMCAGTSFPSVCNFDMLRRAALLIARQCFHEGVIGHVSIDFVLCNTVVSKTAADDEEEDTAGLQSMMSKSMMQQQSDEKKHQVMQLRFLGVSLYRTEAVNSFQLFDFLMDGHFVSEPLPRQNAQQEPKQRSILERQQSAQRRRMERLRGRDGGRGMSRRGGAGGGGGGGGGGGDDEPVQIGQYYVLTDQARMRRQAEGAGLSSAAVYEEDLVSTRSFMAIHYIFQPNLASVQFAAFFSLCRMKGISFDLRERQGTVFVVADSMASGTLGVLCVARGLLPSLRFLDQCLRFIDRQAGALSLSDHAYASESNLALVISAVSRLATRKDVFGLYV